MQAERWGGTENGVARDRDPGKTKDEKNVICMISLFLYEFAVEWSLGAMQQRQTTKEAERGVQHA